MARLRNTRANRAVDRSQGPYVLSDASCQPRIADAKIPGRAVGLPSTRNWRSRRIVVSAVFVRDEEGAGCRVPIVSGLNLDAARQRLRDAGFQVADQATSVNSSSPYGAVVGTTPSRR